MSAGFPPALNNGFFVGFHGKWSLAGIANGENPVVFAKLTTTNYFQFIGNDEPNIGHLDGLLANDDSLFLADLTSTGNTDSSLNSGVIYQIKSLAAHVLSSSVSQNSLTLGWSRGGVLQQADSLAGPWNTIAAGTNTVSIPIDPTQPQSFYRAQY